METQDCAERHGDGTWNKTTPKLILLQAAFSNNKMNNAVLKKSIQLLE
jgi:hypothetical protein